MDQDAERTSTFRAVSEADQTLQDRAPVLGLSELPPLPPLPIAPTPTSKSLASKAPSTTPISKTLSKLPSPKAPPKSARNSSGLLRANATEEVRIQDVLEEVYKPAPRSLPAPRVAASAVPRPGASTPKLASAKSAKPRVDGTEEIAIEDIVAVTALPQKLPQKKNARRASGTEEIAADDILVEVPVPSSGSIRAARPAPQPAPRPAPTPPSIAPLAIDVPIDVAPPQWRVSRPGSLDVESSIEIAERVLGKKRRHFALVSAGAVAAAVLLTIGLAMHGSSSSHASSEASTSLAAPRTPSAEERRLAEVPPPPPANEEPAAEVPAPATPAPVAAAPAAAPVAWKSASTPSWSARASSGSASPRAVASSSGSGGSTGHIRGVGTARDEFIFVDGASAGRGDVVVRCGVHNISVGMGRKARLRVPCGGTLTLGR